MNGNSGVNILLVDDVSENLTVLSAILEPLGHNLVLATSGKAALRHVLRTDFALVLLDVQMPEMDGFETATLIKQRERSRYTPIIFLTASNSEQHVMARGYAAGAVDYIAKPFDPDILCCKVRVFVDLHLMTEQVKRQADLLVQHEQRESERQRRDLELEMEQRHQRAVLELGGRQRNFLRDVLASVTEGRLRFCEAKRNLPKASKPPGKPIKLDQLTTLHYLRMAVSEAAEAARLDDHRTQDLVTAVHEAAMNAIVHAGGGEARISSDPDGKVQVWIKDHGRGIALESLPRATLERGYSTSDTFGHGFWLMLSIIDRVYLLTAATGTTIVLEQQQTPPAAQWYSRGK